MVGADTIARIEIVGMLTVGHDVHGTAQGVAAEPDRHHTLIDLDMVNQIDGQIGKRHTRAFRIKGHTIEEIAHGIARHTVDRQIKIRTDTTLLSQFHTCRTVYQPA